MSREPELRRNYILKAFVGIITIIFKSSKRSEGEVPKNFGNEGFLERRRSYQRGFPTVSCNGVRTKKANVANFL